MHEEEIASLKRTLPEQELNLQEMKQQRMQLEIAIPQEEQELKVMKCQIGGLLKYQFATNNIQ